MMPEAVSGVNVRKVNLYDRQLDQTKGVQECHRGMGKGGGINYDARHLPASS